MSDVVVTAAYPKRLPPRRESPRQRGRLPLQILVGLTAVAGILGGLAISLSAGNPYGAGLSRVIDGLMDGLVYAGLVGVGFAMIENVG